ncbi:trypsin-1 isoform X5 [Bactrocera dorsalis]|uniref:Trypsin-1 isoform X5 n=1 Tax=Bactrocera dorsalis TaxID=27457 RepID=A0ABM3J2J2_BACDO|nr:trypsin-1 isoform X5 [Bactrocera dorsalis]
MKGLLKYLPHIILLIFTLSRTVQNKTRKAEGEPCECEFQRCICKYFSDCKVLYDRKDIDYCNRKQGIVCCPQEPEIPNITPAELASEFACQKYTEMISNDCAREFITGGELARAKEFPPAALVGRFDLETKKHDWFCGGTLISERFVLTASHCAKAGVINRVRLGDLDFSSNKDDEGVQEFSVSRAISHPQYDSSNYNDIMLLELNGTVTFTEYVQPACLLTPSWTVYNTGVFWAVGWGAVDHSTNMSPQLRRVQLKQLNDCGPIANEAHNLLRGLRERTQFCAHGKTNDTCKGDSGGPLLITFPSKEEKYKCLYMVAGIISKGQIECGSQDSPSLNTNVTAFVRFIEFHVWPNKK